MRKALSRFGGIAAGVALTSLLLPAGTAAAETSASCDPADSQVLLEPTNLGGYPDNFIYVDQQGDRRVICFNISFLNTAAGALVIGPVTGGTPLVAVDDTTPSSCPQVIIDNATVGLRFSTSPTAPAFCFRLGTSVAKKIGLDTSQAPGGPTIEVWRDGVFNELDRFACPLEYLAYLEDQTNDDCMTTPTRIFPPA